MRLPRVVNVLCIGAENVEGTGPIEGLHAQAQRLDAIDRIDALHLRPARVSIPIVDAGDIAAFVASRSRRRSILACRCRIPGVT